VLRVRRERAEPPSDHRQNVQLAHALGIQGRSLDVADECRYGSGSSVTRRFPSSSGSAIVLACQGYWSGTKSPGQ